MLLRGQTSIIIMDPVSVSAATVLWPTTGSAAAGERPGNHGSKQPLNFLQQQLLKAVQRDSKQAQDEANDEDGLFAKSLMPNLKLFSLYNNWSLS